MNTPTRPPFWMIARSPRGPNAKTAPTVRYTVEADAVSAAQDLADASDEPFVLLAVTRTIWPRRGQATLL